MDKIKRIISNANPTIADLINAFESVKENGDVGVIKFDGLRDQDQYTVFISFDNNKNKAMIRADEGDLITALLKVLREYVKS
jgi:hypothetical protein